MSVTLFLKTKFRNRVQFLFTYSHRSISRVRVIDAQNHTDPPERRQDLKFWRWIKKEAIVLTALSSIAIALFTGFSLYISFKNITASQNVQDYVVGLKKGEYKIALGNGEYLGCKLLADHSKTPYELEWVCKMNTEPSQITIDNGERFIPFAHPGGTVDF